VCTDAAAEGLNLQTADLLINFDLPWNPMKVEQRIGRIDRIGQRHEHIYVLNLCYVDSAEQIVYDRLLTRLVQAGSIVGTQQISMLPVTLEEFQELAEGRLNEAELERRAKERVTLFKQRTASMELPPSDLYEIYARLGHNGPSRALPVNLDMIWKTLVESRYLRDLGCQVSVNAEQPLLVLRGFHSVPDKSVLTTSRDVFDTGLPGFAGRPSFASYGDPVFEAVLAQVAEYDLPASIKRLTASVDGLKAELVAYAVVALDSGGVSQVRLITSFEDLAGLQIDEKATLTPDVLQPLQTNLAALAWKEFEPVHAVRRLARANAQAGHAQIALDYLVINNLLNLRKTLTKDGEFFWQVMKDIEEVIQGRNQLNIASLPTEIMQRIGPLLLFPAQIPTLGVKASMMAPLPLLRAAIDAGCRVADAMKVRRAELQTESVQARLRREVERELAALYT
jgi:hypothetical protein